MKELIKNSTLIFIVSSLTIFLIVTSCEYEPANKYTLNLIKPTEAPPIDVDLNLLTDTVTFYWGSEVNLRIDPGKLKVNSVKFFLDGNEVFVNYTDYKYYSVFNFPQPGIHKLKVVINTNAATHSLADEIGAEGFRYESREWTLVAKAYNEYSNLIYSIDNSGLHFSWKEYDGQDFKCYRLRERSTGTSFDLQQTSFNHTTYVGEASDFYLYVVDNQKNEYLWGRCYLDSRLPVLRKATINNQIALVWNRTIFSDNISEYRIFHENSGSGWTQIGTIPNTDTIYFIKDIENLYGTSQSFYMDCVPKSYTYIEYDFLFFSRLNNVYLALPGPYFGFSVFGVSCSGFYYDVYSPSENKRSLYSYSIANDKVGFFMDINGWWDFSPNAKYFLYSEDSILDLHDLNTNTIIKSANIKTVAPDFHPSVSPQISDNGICVFTLNDILYVFDLLNDRLIASQYMAIYGLKISPDGHYISGTRSDSLLICQVNENSVNVISGLKQPPKYYDFCADQSDYLYFYGSPFMYVRSSKDLSLIRSINIGEFFYNIDFCSGKILTARTGGALDIYDFSTGDLLQQTGSGVGSPGTNLTFLINNTIYYPGYKYYLND